MKVGWKRKIEKRGGEERSGRRGEERKQEISTDNSQKKYKWPQYI